MKVMGAKLWPSQLAECRSSSPLFGFLNSTRLKQTIFTLIIDYGSIIKLFTCEIFFNGLIFLVCTIFPDNKYNNPCPEYLALADNICVIYSYRILWYCIPNTVSPGKIWIILGFLGIVTSPSKTNNLTWNSLCISTGEKPFSENSWNEPRYSECEQFTALHKGMVMLSILPLNKPDDTPEFALIFYNFSNINEKCNQHLCDSWHHVNKEYTFPAF